MNCFGLGVGVEIYEVVQNVKLYRSMRCALYIHVICTTVSREQFAIALYSTRKVPRRARFGELRNSQDFRPTRPFNCDSSRADSYVQSTSHSRSRSTASRSNILDDVCTT